MQNRTPAEKAGPPSKGGRPRKSYDHLIDTAHNFLIIDRIFRCAKNEPYAATTCTRCGTHSECRLRDILSGHTKSCKCLRPEQYLTNIKTLADRIPDQKVAQMWSMHFAGSGRWAIAAAHKVAVIVVDFALRRYQRFLDRVISSGFAPWIAKQTAHPVPAQVAEYLQKSECRVLNIFRRARAAEAEMDARCRAWEWMMRQWMRDNIHFMPIDSDAVVEFLNQKLRVKGDTMEQGTLITDGFCIGNPGSGGWAFIRRPDEYSKCPFAGTQDGCRDFRTCR